MKKLGTLALCGVMAACAAPQTPFPTSGFDRAVNAGWSAETLRGLKNLEAGIPSAKKPRSAVVSHASNLRLRNFQVCGRMRNGYEDGFLKATNFNPRALVRDRRDAVYIAASSRDSASAINPWQTLFSPSQQRYLRNCQPL